MYFRRIPILLVILFCVLLGSACTVEVESPVQPVAPSTSTTSAVQSATHGPAATRVPVTWAALQLTGKLIYLSNHLDGDTSVAEIQMLDLETGELSTLFSAPNAWIYYATISPDAKSLVMSYSPPSTSPSGRILYRMSLDQAAQPEPLFPPPTPDDRYTQVEWSPDGKYLYYVHYNHAESGGTLYEKYELFRMEGLDGEAEKIADYAFWPRLSPDSGTLVYVSIEPDTGNNGLYVANADGSNARRVELTGAGPLDIIDAPIFSPDGQSILFSAPEQGQASQPNWLERLAGIQVARAHNVPSDWWSVSTAGGTPEQLTKLQTINLFGSFSPDGKYLASLSGEGVLVMGVDGSNLTRLISDPEVHGTVSWIP